MGRQRRTCNARCCKELSRAFADLPSTSPDPMQPSGRCGHRASEERFFHKLRRDSPAAPPFACQKGGIPVLSASGFLMPIPRKSLGFGPKPMGFPMDLRQARSKQKARCASNGIFWTAAFCVQLEIYTTPGPRLHAGWETHALGALHGASRCIEAGRIPRPASFSASIHLFRNKALNACPPHS